MRFKLYELEVKRSDDRSKGHIVASSHEHAEMVMLDHDEALRLEHERFSLKRVDHVLKGHERHGLDALLEGAPAGFASWCNLGWVAHATAVHKLRLYRSANSSSAALYSVAPNAGVAAMLFASTPSPGTLKTHLFFITDVTDNRPPDPNGDLELALKIGPVGVAIFDEEYEHWVVG